MGLNNQNTQPYNYAQRDAKNGYPVRVNDNNTFFTKEELLKDLGLTQAAVPNISPLQSYYGLRNYLANNPNTVFNVIMAGDSRIEQVHFPEAFKKMMFNTYGYAGIGFFIPGDFAATGILSAYLNTGVTHIAGSSGGTGNGTYGLNGKCNDYTSAGLNTGFTTTADKWGVVSSVTCYYLQRSSGGILEFSIQTADGKNTLATTRVDTNGSAAVKSVTLNISPMANIKVNALSVTTNCTSLGFDCRNGETKGVVIHRAGCGTRTPATFAGLLGNAAWATALNPNLLITLNAYNNDSTGSAIAQNRTDIMTYVNAMRTPNFTSSGNDITGLGFSALVLGETTTKSTSIKNMTNSAYYSLTLPATEAATSAIHSSQYVDFLNLRDYVKDWTTLNNIPNFAISINDAVHFGSTLGQLIAELVYKRIHGIDVPSYTTLFPRLHAAWGLNVTTYTLTGTPNAGVLLFNGEAGIYAGLGRLRVVVNGLERVNANTAFGYTLSGDILTAYDSAGVQETIKTISIEVLP